MKKLFNSYEIKYLIHAKVGNCKLIIESIQKFLINNYFDLCRNRQTASKIQKNISKYDTKDI